MKTNYRSLSKLQGFTLLEVMIAMAIFATVASMAFFGIGQAVKDQEQLRYGVVASWLAQNRTIELLLAAEKTYPKTGVKKDPQPAEMANRKWQIEVKVADTEIPNIRKATISVALLAEEGDSIFSNKKASYYTQEVLLGCPDATACL